MTLGDDGWLTWPQAAELVGCPVPTIDWHTRTGRIKHRPRQGTRPSLERGSVEEFATWWQERQTEREQRRQTRRPGDLGPGWLTVAEAADQLDLSVAQVRRLAHTGRLRSVRPTRHFRIAADDVQRLARVRRGWVSLARAAAIVGCSVNTIQRAVDDGHIEQRPVMGPIPSLLRASVDDFAITWRQRAEEQARRRAAPPARPRRPDAAGPPDDGQVWLDATTAALILDVSTERVRHLARADRIPATRFRQRWWFRRLDMEQLAAARVLATGANRSI